MDCDKIRNAINNGISWVSNRFGPSNIAYNVAAGVNFDWIMKVLENMYKPEYGIFLDTSPKIGFMRNIERRKKDINERVLSYQERVYDAYWMMIDKKIFVKKWVVVDGEGTMDEVAANLENALAGVVPEIRRKSN